MLSTALSSLLMLFGGSDASLVDDAYTLPIAATKNFGKATTLKLAGAGSRALLKFSFSNLPPGTTGAQIEKAQLRLFVNKVTASGSFDVVSLSGSWSEIGVTAGFGPTNGSPAATNTPVTPGDVLDFVSVDVTNLVRAWVDGLLTNDGLAVTPSNGSTLSVEFDSKENAKTAHEPELRLAIKPVLTTGATGPAGPVGPVGPQGPQGPSGTSPFGLNGGSAYYTAGYVGIGTISPSATLHVSGGGRIDGHLNMGASTTIFFDANGHVQTQGGGPLHLNPFPGAGDVIVGGGNGANLVVLNNAFKPGGGSWAVLSDARQKHDIQPLEGSLDRLLQLQGRTYYYNDVTLPGAAPGKQVGFIAQEVEKVFPNWVTEVKGNKTLGITGFEALSVEAMRTLKQENDELKARIEKLEAAQAEMAELKASLETLLGKR